MKDDTYKIINIAYEKYLSWGIDLDDTLKSPEDIMLLVERQKKYDDFVKKLSSNKNILKYLQQLLTESETWALNVVIVHIGLLSKDESLFNLENQKTHLAIVEALSYCSQEIIEFWFEHLIVIAKQFELNVIDYYAHFVATNCLKEYVKYFLNEEENLILNDYSTHLMLAYTEHKNAKELLLKDMFDTNSETSTSAANALLILGEEQGMDFFRRLLINDEYYEDNGREIALFGNKSDVILLQNYFDRNNDDTDILNRIHLNGSKELIIYFSHIIRTNTIDEVKNIASFYIKTTYLQKNISKKFTKLLKTKDYKELVQVWDTWTKDNYNEYIDQRYYKYKKPFNIKQTLLEVKMNFNDPIGFARWQRLAIYTGKRLPFDPKAYYEKQLSQNKAMEDWIEHNIDQFPDGRWYRFGKDVTNEISPLIDINNNTTVLDQNLVPKIHSQG